MHENILNYFIECVNTEAKEKIQIEGRINGQVTDKVTPLNSNNIRELEKKDSNGFYILETDGREIKPKWIEIKITNKEIITINGNNREPHNLQEAILREIEKRDLQGKIVLLKIEGVL